MSTPRFVDYLDLYQAVEDLAIEQLVAELAVEALAVALLLRAAGLYVGRPRADSGNPCAQSLRDEVRVIV